MHRSCHEINRTNENVIRLCTGSRNLYKPCQLRVWEWCLDCLCGYHVDWYLTHFDMITNIWTTFRSNTLSPRQNGRRFTDHIFKFISLNENIGISIIMSLKYVPRGPIDNKPALVQVMAWRRTGDKPLSEPLMTQFSDAYIRHSASMS